MTIILISSKAERDLESINDRMVSYSRKAANRQTPSRRNL